MNNIEGKMMEQNKQQIKEAAGRIWEYGIRYGCADSVDVNDLEYICNAALFLIRKVERLERELEEHRIVKCRDCKHWEGGTDESVYADWCQYLERITTCEFYCEKGEGKDGA